METKAKDDQGAGEEESVHLSGEELRPPRALGDLTGINKHFSRKHGEKKWKCEKCSKKYAVMSDWKAHSKICGTREYTCDCGTLFSRKDSFITHRAFCDALAEESGRSPNNAELNLGNINLLDTTPPQMDQPGFTNLWHSQGQSSHQWLLSGNNNNIILQQDHDNIKGITSASLLASGAGNNANNYNQNGGQMSATALLHKATQIGSKRSSSSSNNFTTKEIDERGFTRDFLGLGSHHRPWPLLIVNNNCPDMAPPANMNR